MVNMLTSRELNEAVVTGDCEGERLADTVLGMVDLYGQVVVHLIRADSNQLNERGAKEHFTFQSQVRIFKDPDEGRIHEEQVKEWEGNVPNNEIEAACGFISFLVDLVNDLLQIARKKGEPHHKGELIIECFRDSQDIQGNSFDNYLTSVVQEHNINRAN